MNKTKLQTSLQRKFQRRPHAEDRKQAKFHYQTAKNIAEHTDYKKDRPEYGKVYALTGGKDTPCIANGNTWAESLVK